MCNCRTYKTLNYPTFTTGDKTLLTGVRQKDHSDKIYISGFYEPSSGPQTSFIYKGCVCGKGKFYNLNYPPVNNTPTITSLYGPNNGIHKNSIHVVGNYAIQNQNSALGCLFQGSLNGVGTWTTIIPSPLTTDSDPVINTICHSNMGKLVVGNFDTTHLVGRAFIYNIYSHNYYEITHPDALNITAYGIWHNGKHSYTICGGFLTNVSNVAYIVDWNNKTHTFHNWQTYNFDNDPIKAKITHFDGITAGLKKNTYNLTGVWLGHLDIIGKGFFTHVKRKCDGKFNERAYWESILYPDSDVTTGNTVYKNTVIGVYSSINNNDTVNGYISNFIDC